MGAHLNATLMLQQFILTKCRRRGLPLLRYPSSVKSPYCKHDALTLNILVTAPEPMPRGTWCQIRGEIVPGTRQCHLDVEVFEGGMEVSGQAEQDSCAVIWINGYIRESMSELGTCHIVTNTSQGSLVIM